MFPSPISRRSAGVRAWYVAVVLVTLAVWVLPLMGVALTSVRPLEDLNRGHVWSWPSEVRFLENYGAVLTSSNMMRFVWNSIVVTIPAVAGSVLLSSMAGFALAKHRFAGNRLLLVDHQRCIRRRMLQMLLLPIGPGDDYAVGPAAFAKTEV